MATLHYSRFLTSPAVLGHLHEYLNAQFDYQKRQSIDRVFARAAALRDEVGRIYSPSEQAVNDLIRAERKEMLTVLALFAVFATISFLGLPQILNYAGSGTWPATFGEELALMWIGLSLALTGIFFVASLRYFVNRSTRYLDLGLATIAGDQRAVGEEAVYLNGSDQVIRYDAIGHIEAPDENTVRILGRDGSLLSSSRYWDNVASHDFVRLVRERIPTVEQMLRAGEARD